MNWGRIVRLPRGEGEDECVVCDSTLAFAQANETELDRDHRIVLSKKPARVRARCRVKIPSSSSCTHLHDPCFSP